MHASHGVITCSSLSAHLPIWDLTTHPLLRHAVHMRPQGLAAPDLADLLPGPCIRMSCPFLRTVTLHCAASSFVQLYSYTLFLRRFLGSITTL